MFIPIVNTSISASWLILAIIVIRLVFKKMPKAVTCVLWGLVAIRLICPFSIESPLSLVPSAEIIPEEVLYMEGAQLHDPVEFNGIEAPTIQETVGEAVGETVSQVQTFDVYGSLVWLAGMTAMLLYALISYLRLRRRVIVSINERDNIWLCDQIDSPFILGMFRPRIYMPSGMAEEQAAYVIAHEQAHLQRHDHWWKPFGFLLLAVYWFSPLIWVAYILLSRDIELACDEKVIQSMETADKQAYSEALLVCSVNRRMIAACPLAFGEVGVKARVKSVLNYKKPAFWVIVISVIVCMVVAVCFLTNPVGFRFDRESDVIVSASLFDMRNAEDPVADEMNLAQIGELRSRLADVKKIKRSDKYGGLTPGYQISALLQDGSYLRVSGYSLSDNDMVDIEWNGERYVVYDNAFQNYLSHICASGDVASADNAVADKTYTYEKDGIMDMSNVPATSQEDITAEDLDLFKQGALNDATLSQTEEEAQEVVEVEEPEPEPERVEAADHSNTADMNRWHREIEGKSVSYVCGEENNTYAAPPTWRPVFTEAGWSLVKIHHDTRNYTASWTYEKGNQQIVFKCAAPSTASFGRQMSNADVATNSQQIEILGKKADYYDDGSAKVLAWESEDGILFFVTGKNTNKEALLSVAKSVKNCTTTVSVQSLGWMPSGYSMMSHYVIADTVMEYWVRDNVAMSWTCSAEPLGLPSGTGIATAIKNNEATYWAAEEPLALGTSVITVDGQAISIGGGVSSFTVPSPENLNTLAWQNAETGIYYRLQSILDMDTMIRIAEHIE